MPSHSVSRSSATPWRQEKRITKIDSIKIALSFLHSINQVMIATENISEVTTLTLPLGILGSVDSLLAAIFCFGIPHRKERSDVNKFISVCWL
jgi:hypothetical protein